MFEVGGVVVDGPDVHPCALETTGLDPEISCRAASSRLAGGRPDLSGPCLQAVDSLMHVLTGGGRGAWLAGLFWPAVGTRWDHDP